jgi:hypothetical protein
MADQRLDVKPAPLAIDPFYTANSLAVLRISAESRAEPTLDPMDIQCPSSGDHSDRYVQ